MSVLVTDAGFAPAAQIETVALDQIAAHKGALELAHTDDPQSAQAFLSELTLIRVSFPAFSDGRGFTVGRRLRMMGYTGQLHAVGPLLADQYPMARRVGFDAVEIPDDLALRQPVDQWRFRADWQSHDYLNRLRGGSGQSFA